MIPNSRKFLWEALPHAPNGTTCRSSIRTTHPLLLLILFLVSCASPTATPSNLNPAHAPIAQILDGDTVVVEFANGHEETVRLLGIDTPETIDPTRPVQCFGNEATAELTRLVPVGTSIRLERDVEARDRFGRLLSYIYRSSDELFVNAALLEDGFADLSIYEPNSTYRSELTNAATTARTSSIGLWGTCGGPDVPLDPTD